MSHDGTTHSDGTTVANSARTIVDLYYRNVNTTATTRDVWQVGDALLNDIDGLDVRVEVIEEDLETFESRTERRLKALEQKMSEAELVVAEMIFDLNELGIEFSFKEVYNFRKKYLKK